MNRITIFLAVICVLIQNCIAEESIGKGDSLPANVNPPHHVHLSLSKDHTVLNVVWITFPLASDSLKDHSFVQYGETPNNYPYHAKSISRRVEYAEDLSTDNRVTVAHHAKLSGLRPGALYYYRVGSPSNWSKHYQFRVPPGPSFNENNGRHIRFAAYGDMGIGTEAQMTLNLLEARTLPAEHSLDFILHAGDMAYGFGNFTKWNTWFERAERLAAYTPYMISPGNRDEVQIVKERFEMPSDSTVNMFSTTANDDKSLYLVFDKTRPHLYYAFDYGFIHVISLSFYDSCKRGSEQYEWLEKTLEHASRRLQNENDVLQWIVLFGHTPLYSSSNGHTGGDKALRESIEHLLLKYHIHVAIWGDDHNYERSYPMYDGVPDTNFQNGRNEDGDVSVFVNPMKPIHLLAGTAGIGLDGWTEENPPVWSAYREIAHGFLEFDVTENYLKAKFIRSNDSVVTDQFWIVKQGNGLRNQAFIFIGLAVVCGVALFLAKEKNIHLPLPIGRKHT